MSLRERLENDLKSAMRAGDTLKVSVIRMAKSEMRNTEIAKGAELVEDEILQVLSKEGKKRRESVEQYRKGRRDDLADKEFAELQILNEYLPEQLDDAKIADVTQEVISELHATSKADKGRVMSAVMQRVKGKADGKTVSRIVDHLLNGDPV
jgi:hypothetical protein